MNEKQTDFSRNAHTCRRDRHRLSDQRRWGGQQGRPGNMPADAAEALRGMHRMTDRQAMQKTGATIVRQIMPGQGVTMDYRRERVTIETDPKTGKIVRAACG